MGRDRITPGWRLPRCSRTLDRAPLGSEDGVWERSAAPRDLTWGATLGGAAWAVPCTDPPDHLWGPPNTDHPRSPQHRPSDGVPQHRPSWTIHGVPPNIPALAAALGCSRAQWGWSHPLAPTSISSTTTLG